MTDLRTVSLSNGMTVVIEPIASAASAAISWLLPLGSATDAASCDGHAAMLSELIFRGADGLSSREHSDAFDRLGVQRTSNVQTNHLQIGATLLGGVLDETLPLVTSMVTDPALPDEAVDPVRSLCLQSLESLEDDPQYQVMLALREQHRPAPYNRHGYGDRQVLEHVTPDELRAAWADRCVPGGSILTVAGAIEVEPLISALESRLGAWTGERADDPERQPPKRGYRCIEQDTAQVHIAVAWDAPPEPDPDSMLERLAITVLSGSTSGRLFTEVRQKRSLCYSVGASYRAGRDDGAVSLYAGTTPERAQETLDVSLQEIERLSQGVEAEELARAAIGLKSRIVMGGESTPARAARLASDFFRLERARPLDELTAAIDAVTLDDLNEYLTRRSPGPFTMVSVGPAPLEVGAIAIEA